LDQSAAVCLGALVPYRARPLTSRHGGATVCPCRCKKTPTSTVASFSTAGWSGASSSGSRPTVSALRRVGSRGWRHRPLRRTLGGRASLIVEALGYLGGVLIVVAAILIANWYWASIPTWGRVALPVAGAALLAGAGWLAYRHRAARTARLRAVLWLASTAAVAVALSVAGRDLLGLPDDENLALSAGVGTAAYAGLLYVRFPTFLEQLALFAGLAVSAGTAAWNLPNGGDAPTGLAIWGLGAMWLAFGWGNLLPPRRGSLALGAVGTLVGAMITLSGGDWGYFFALITVAALVALAVLLGDLLMLGTAAVGALQVLPATVMHFFPGAISTATWPRSTSAAVGSRRTGFGNDRAGAHYAGRRYHSSGP
jgi:hypothetical protein